jgi:hypothetical protein
MGRLGAEDFLWGDWNGDGIVGDEEGKTFEDLYGGSSYGEDYWEAFAKNAANDNKTASQNEMASKIQERLDSGLSFEEAMESLGYNIARNSDDHTVIRVISNDRNEVRFVDMEELTGKSIEYWENAGRTYKNNKEGRAGILDAMANSLDGTLSQKDQEEFDALFGNGAYNELKDSMFDLRTDLHNAMLTYINASTLVNNQLPTMDDSTVQNLLTSLKRDIAQIIPEITEDQLFSIIESTCPDFIDAMANPDGYLRENYSGEINSRLSSHKKTSGTLR